MDFVLGFLSLLGRLMLCALFLMATVAYLIPQFGKTVEDMAAQGVPAPRLMLIGAITLMIVGSLLIIFGYKTRLGALLLLIFLGFATFYYHDFWNVADDQTRVEQLYHFMKNLGLAGTMVLLLANGGGAWALDRRSREQDDDLI